jgi:hypothetical protein
MLTDVTISSLFSFSRQSAPVRRAFGNVRPEETLLKFHTILLEVHVSLQIQKLFAVSTDLKSSRSLCDHHRTILAGQAL